ncbi:Multidrug resistance protein MdtA [Sporomusa silvacetica DSM 10669]|uniref:Multidrug resistance protein MdtA n=1 Tax=Sporomusa silvacetica DSM 10669 TaxID=1123289 RepID=A0ABZ3IU07_9FIRM|nr:efflux RND transporter periplasmic adaptor subunit [Sporomusa silvacetica]OZC21075.1 multidrug resistance protein MdtA precursor [Sporomusa silvacetica DSM 10669]
MQKVIAGCIALTIMILSLSFAGCSKTETVQEEAPLVRSQTIKMDAMGQTASYSGEVRGRYETQLAFQVSGKIIRRNIELGSVVNSGDVLMEIDAKDVQQTVNISSAQVASAQSQLGLAQSNLERYRKLYEQNAISRAQLDQYENTYEVALATVNQSTAQYAQGANQLGYTSLVADSDGVISNVNVEAGQVVSAGQAVMTLVKGGEREIEINVPENRIDEMRNAQQVNISFWALPDVTTVGKVREISPVADKVARTYKVRISLINPPAAVNLGMTASVAVGSSTSQQAVYIPLAAIYQTGDTPNVWVIQAGIVSLRPIKVGAFGDGKVQVLEGLQDGEVIATGGVQKLREGQKVRL